MALKAVVLPAPFGPMRPTSSRGASDRLKSARALRPPNCIETWRASRTALMASSLEAAGPDGEHLVAGGVDAHGLGRHLVLTDGEERAAVGASYEPAGHGDGRDHAEADPDQIRVRRKAGKAGGAAEPLGVFDEHPDDLAEAERHD